MQGKLQFGSATYTEILRYTTSLGVKAHSNRSMKFRQQGNRLGTYKHHLTAREHTPQASRKIHREVNRCSYQYAYLHHLPDLEPATTSSCTTQASRMERGNWADYEGRTRTTRQHLPQIHEQRQTDDPRTMTTKLTQIWNYKTTAYNYLYLQTRIK